MTPMDVPLEHMCSITSWKTLQGEEIWQTKCSEPKCTWFDRGLSSDEVIHKGALHELQFIPLEITRWKEVLN